MDRVKNLRSPKIYIAFALALVVSLLFFPNEGRFKYKYQKGRPWLYETLLAQIDFPILKTDSELLKEKEEKSTQVLLYFDYDKVVASTRLTSVRDLEKSHTLNYAFLKELVESFDYVYDRGVLGAYDDSYSSEDRMIIVQRDKRAVEVPLSEVFDVNKAGIYIKSSLSQSFPHSNIDSLYSALSIEKLIVPNLIYDKKKTDLIHRNAVDYISPTKGIVYTGQLIVSEGEIITPEIEQLLDSYKVEYENSYGFSGSTASLVAGHGMLVAVVLILIFAVIYFVDIKIFNSPSKYYFILTIFLVLFISTVLVRDSNPHMLYLLPYAVFALYIVSFFKQSFAFPLYAVMLLPLLFLAQNGVELYIMNLFSGMIAIVSFYYLNIGWLQFINSLFIFFGLLFVFAGFQFFTEGSLQAITSKSLLYLALNALFVVAAYPLVFLFEKLFSLVSNSKLRELSDTNGKLLLELANRAPGTFQHSLQVSNMADAAVREIGGEVLLVRVGALYHDIGKMTNPQCFVENQAVGVEYHKNLSPIESAGQIIRHVDDGVELAKKYKLPGVISDFIKTHHAQTLTAYFYAVYCNNGGDPSNTEPFTYHGELPKTKEQVIVLMADAVEAASRSLKDYSEESITKLIESIIAKRLSDSQLINADISIREITMVKEVFKRHLMQVYHERIAYPELKK